MTNEEKILILSAKINFSPEDKDKIKKLLHYDINWPDFIKLAKRYEILPLVASNLIKIDDDRLSKSELEKLLLHNKTNYALNNMVLWDEFKKIIDIANHSKIPIMPIKGIILNHTLYKDTALRWTNDIDILIKKEYLTQIEPQMYKLGYELEDKDLTKRNLAIDKHQHLAFQKKTGLEKPIKTDIHWDVLDAAMRIKGMTGDFWKNAETIQIFKQDILTLSSQDMLFESIAEFFKDHINERYFLLKRHIDISQILYLFGSEINWDIFIKRTRHYRLNGWVYYVLSSNYEMFNNKIIPEKILPGLKPPLYKKILAASIKKTCRLKKMPRLKELIFIAGLIVLFRNWKVLFTRFFSWLLDKTII